MFSNIKTKPSFFSFYLHFSPFNYMRSLNYLLILHQLLSIKNYL